MKDSERSKSYKLYKIACERFIKYMGGDFPLMRITPMNIQEFAKNLQREQLTDTTIKIYLTLIKVIINYADKMNYVSYSIHPFVLFKIPIARIREADLSVEEIKNKRCGIRQAISINGKRLFMLTYYLGGINLIDLAEYDFKEKGKNIMRYMRHKTRNSKKVRNCLF